ncbi:MAG TPA: cytochrome ubiquinol oxidase subunit I [Ktedonobacteraceae bacterium]|nr:cytochrome ubiquinol oxidase subunit I [Ktedonobacteraceae bacterium]
MPGLFAARAQMGTSLAFHIIFSALGVGLPLLLCIAEGLALKKKDSDWMLLTRRWAKAAAILFAIGAVSGTILSFELGLLWPTYTRFAGAVVGLPFALEGFAFFLEAIFLGLYLYGWDRLSPRAHWLCSFPIWISGLASAWFIVSANSWMNTPAGFVIHHGKIVDINPWQAMLNPATPYETIHMMLACYVATGFSVAAVYAFTILRGQHSPYHWKALRLALAMGAIAIPLQIISGDANARFLAARQPIKLAAMEGVFLTASGVPLKIGGLVDPDNGKVHFAIEIPYGLSILAKGDPHATIQGLDSVPRQDWPILGATHLSFDGMVASGLFILLIGSLFWLFAWLKKRTWQEQRWMLWCILLTGPLSFLAIELGWMVTEFGRQPWVIVGYLRTADAVTTAPGLNISFLLFSLIYILLSFALIRLLLRLARSPFPSIKLPWSSTPYQPDPTRMGV